MKTLTERHVQAIWYDAALRPERLFTRRGSAVRVVSPGEWNLGPGPDFRGAVLEVDSPPRRLTGDVEVHLCPADWDFHAHGSDPGYRNVVAHVTWGCGPDPATLPPGAISIWLGRFVSENPAFSPESIDLTAYPFARLPESPRPCAERFGGDPDRAHEVLAAAGRHRLRMKARRLGGRLAESSRNARGGAGEARRQVFYEEVMGALGYVKNSSGFRHVSERIPIAELPRDGEAARTAYLVAATFEEWDRSACRPGNSPEARLAKAAEMFTKTTVMELAEADDFSRKACRRMIGEMCFGGVLGRGRAAAVMANVIVPFAIAEGRLAEAPEWLPVEDISSPMRLMAFRMFGRDHNPAAFYAQNGLYAQGLLQIRRDSCLAAYPNCAECGLGQSLD